MTIVNTAFLKVGGGLIATGATAGAGVYAHQTGLLKKIFFNDVIEDYLVVAVHEAIETGKKPTKSPYETTPNNSKNFKCFLKDKEEDETCDIFKITETKATEKIVTLEDFNKVPETKITSIDDLAKGKLFKLNINKSKFTSPIKYDSGDYVIDLRNTVNNETDKPSYGKLKVLAKISGDKVTTDYKKIIVKTTSNNIDASTTNYKCNVNGNTEADKLDCKIYKFSTDISALANVTFASTLTEVTDAQSSTVKPNNYYVIDFSTVTGEKLKKLTIENLKKTIIFQGTDTAKKAEFLLEELFVGTYTDASNNKVFSFKP